MNKIPTTEWNLDPVIPITREFGQEIFDAWRRSDPSVTEVICLPDKEFIFRDILDSFAGSLANLSSHSKKDRYHWPGYKAGLVGGFTIGYLSSKWACKFLIPNYPEFELIAWKRSLIDLLDFDAGLRNQAYRLVENRKTDDDFFEDAAEVELWKNQALGALADQNCEASWTSFRRAFMAEIVTDFTELTRNKIDQCQSKVPDLDKWYPDEVLNILIEVNGFH